GISAGGPALTAMAVAVAGSAQAAMASALKPPGKAAGGPVPAGPMYTVNENGPETVVPATNGYIIPHGASAGGSTGAGGSNQPIIVQMVLDGRVLHQSLLKQKRDTGGGLGLGCLMTLALDTSWASVQSDPALVSSLTTGAATPPAGSVLFASVLFDTVAATAITMSTVTGSTSAWTTVENPTVSNGLVGLYWATVTSSISTTVEAAFSTSSDCALKVYIATGANVVTPVGAHGHTLITHSPTAVSYTATAVGSIGLVVVENDTGRAVGISATTTDETLTSNSKGTIAHQSSPSAGLNAQTFTVTGTSAGPACAWLEIMPAAGGSPAMDTLPVDHIKVEVAFDTVPDDPSPVWTDVSQWVRLEVGVAITTGRADEYAAVQTGTCKLALDNTDGRFTPGNVGSPYWPNVKIRRKLRVSYTNPAGGPTIYRFTGYMEEWPVEWPTGGQTYSVSQISATDRF